MNRRFNSIFVIGLAILLSIMFVTSASAINYDIGSVSSGGGNVDWYMYDSGASVKISNDKYLDYLHLILDGNTSTGLDHNFGPDSSGVNVMIYFPFSVFVNNITIKPVYNGSASSCSLFISNDYFGVNLASAITKEKTYAVNVTIKSIQITLDNGGTNHFYFNDIIIDYVPVPTNLQEVIATITILTNNFQNLNNEYKSIRNELETINNYIYESDSQLLENITKLWNSFNMLNESITYLSQQLQHLNISVYRNITSIENDVNSINQEISNLYEAIQNLTEVDEVEVEEDDPLEDINDRLNNTADDITNLYDNITLIRKSIMEGLDDGDESLLDKIFQLEGENAVLRQELDNLTTRMDNIKNTETKTIIEDGDGNNALMFGALGIGLIAIIIAIISLLMKRGRPEEADEPEAGSREPELEPQVQSVAQAPLAQPAYTEPPPLPVQEIPQAQEAAVVQPAAAASEQVADSTPEQQPAGT